MFIRLSIFLVFAKLSISLSFAQSPLQNHPSEYLAMHAKDPVQWHLWNTETLIKAQQQNKLILVSSGYFSCHWCHVTQKELYQNSEIANKMNQLFINIKVDRELTPEIDRQMIDFAKRIVGAAGWPQHVIYTPAGKPFAAFTYLPKDDFTNYLQNLENLWKTEQSKIEQLASRQNSTKTTIQPNAAQSITNLSAQITDSVKKHMDDFSGGIKGSHKFPNSPLLLSLLKQKNLPAGIKEWLKLTLKQMQSQHLFDHVYGGFYRYTVDPEWQTPHFEKMLYDNAQLLEVYLRAAMKWPESDFLQTAENTLNFLRKHLFDDRLKLYLGSQSALDQFGQEGGDYLWTQNALKNQLSIAEFELVEAEWNLNHTPPYELGFHPKPTSKYWSSIQAKLQKRNHKQPIPTDSKAIVAWNALLLSALNVATEISQSQSLPAGEFPNLSKSAQLTEQLANRLAEIILESNIPRALAWQNKQVMSLATVTLEEVAYGLKALAKLPENITSPVHQQAIQQLLQQAQSFSAKTGWRFTTTSPHYEWHIADNELPSPTAILNCYQAQSPALKTLPAGKEIWQFSSYLNHYK
ncbi:thioredoxin domain-containing protein [Thiomicrorhabdus indica]|uniref:thioredoxin domain-containing protein n=1 Tax=Thiomicrorhabdus indica TaxID=2267253 RepID=UPI00102D9FB2|nr:DUF255 domain-containing protein [Thiomicrorhabdus indica]